MAQFTIYSSGDASGPGSIQGQGGFLLTILDACLVNGYSGKAAAGWTKPIANSGNIGIYTQGTGSAGLTLLINDNGPNVTSTFKEAWATGWESVATIAAPVGTGSGQFPTAAQLLTTGHTSIRKSTTADTTNRAWVLFADSRTFYMFIISGDAPGGSYFPLWFGDLYSLKSTTDSYRCFIRGGIAENSATAANHPWDLQQYLATAQSGFFIARAFGGGGGSITASYHGNTAASGSGLALLSTLTNPNGPDSSYYLSPLWVCDVAVPSVRGRLRGLYHLCHPLAGFTDGQTFAGTGAYAGKTFYVLLRGPNNGMVAVETSDTLETN